MKIGHGIISIPRQMDLGSLHTGGSVMSDDKAYMSYEEYLENVKKSAKKVKE